jgi:hypothetical protein
LGLSGECRRFAAEGISRKAGSLLSWGIYLSTQVPLTPWKLTPEKHAVPGIPTAVVGFCDWFPAQKVKTPSPTSCQLCLLLSQGNLVAHTSQRV